VEPHSSIGSEQIDPAYHTCESRLPHGAVVSHPVTCVRRRRLCSARVAVGVVHDEAGGGEVSRMASHHACCHCASQVMEEAEALCQRLAIMKLGQLTCIGTPQHLKAVHGKGYRLEVKVAVGTAVDSVTRDILASFPTATVVDAHGGMVSLELARRASDDDVIVPLVGGVTEVATRPASELSLSALFSSMETMLARGDIVDYGVSQTSLEQVRG
jgi:hypothetical protein